MSEPVRPSWVMYPWQDEPLLTRTHYDDAPTLIVAEPPSSSLAFSTVSRETVTPTRREHVLRRDYFEYGRKKWVVYRAEGDDRFEKAFALYTLADRLIDFIWRKVPVSLMKEKKETLNMSISYRRLRTPPHITEEVHEVGVFHDGQTEPFLVAPVMGTLTDERKLRIDKCVLDLVMECSGLEFDKVDRRLVNRVKTEQ